MRRSRAIVLSAVLVALALPIVAAPAAARDRATAERDRIVAFWAPRRIPAPGPRARTPPAGPRDFVKGGTGRFEPRKGKPGGGGGNNVIGASWTAGGLV